MCFASEISFSQNIEELSELQCKLPSSGIIVKTDEAEGIYPEREVLIKERSVVFTCSLI